MGGDRERIERTGSFSGIQNLESRFRSRRNVAAWRQSAKHCRNGDGATGVSSEIHDESAAHASRSESLDAFVDAHVHIYPSVALASVFSAVLRHAAARARAQEARASFLVLAEPDGVDGFGRLLALAEGARPAPAGWTAVGIGDGEVRFRHERGFEAVFARARQLVTAEGLEVLAVGADRRMRSGEALARTLERVRAAECWAVLAWGAGKWVGRRGRLVDEAVRIEAGSGDVFLGDNGGRPRLWPRIRQFDLAAERGMPILPGSDPLPVPGDERRIGSYGFEIGLERSVRRPLHDVLRCALTESAGPVRVSGRRVDLVRFAGNQLRLRLARSATRDDPR